MLTGIIDFARDHLLTGWARGADRVPLTFSVNIDGAAIPAIGSASAQEPALVKFRITLPRSITASELVDRSVTVEAIQGDARLVLPLWKPIQVAALLDELDENMIERTVSCLQVAAQEHLKSVIMRKQSEVEALRLSGKELSPAAMSELMRWS